MSSADLLVDGFGRIREIVHDVLDGLTDSDLQYRVEPAANSICWQIWHLTRVQDDHVAAAGGLTQVWLSGWETQFGLPLHPRDIGYGHSADQAGAVHAPANLLAGYHDATYGQTIAFVSTLTEDDMPRVVDRSWQPPVTMAVRLVSVLTDDLEHVGQAAFIRGLIERRR
ncbi:MAG: mycothiol transferase [Streptosporangiaceae bacterium]